MVLLCLNKFAQAAQVSLATDLFLFKIGVVWNSYLEYTEDITHKKNIYIYYCDFLKKLIVVMCYENSAVLLEKKKPHIQDNTVIISEYLFLKVGKCYHY